uniref:FUN14 domain-containing protein 1 n=1 Tax=Glossina austeni TaxID=7395 RepID=A0A1A9URM5_GLOAU
MADKASKFLGGLLGNISSRSAYSQIAIGTSTGWVTGYTTMKVGKFAAFAIGGGIILLEIAHQEGYVKIDWSKVTKKIDKVSGNVERAITAREQTWTDKAERYVDRQLNIAEDIVKRKSNKVKRWYSNLIGDEEGPKINDLHIFLTAFVGGVALGIACA